MVSPYSKVNFVDHSVTDQSSILRFIEDNWNLGRIGGGSFDEIAGSLDNMFDFSGRHHAASRLPQPDDRPGELRRRRQAVTPFRIQASSPPVAAGWRFRKETIHAAESP